MRLMGLWMIAVLLLAPLGCGNKKPSLDERLTAAEAITDPTDSDKALETVAREAASAGKSDVVSKALKKMHDEDKRDQVAGACAFDLAKHGKGKAANEIAKLIGNKKKHDEVLEKLAKGKMDQE